MTSPPIVIVFGGELMVTGLSTVTGFSTVDTFDMHYSCSQWWYARMQGTIRSPKSWNPNLLVAGPLPHCRCHLWGFPLVLLHSFLQRRQHYSNWMMAGLINQAPAACFPSSETSGFCFLASCLLFLLLSSCLMSTTTHVPVISTGSSLYHWYDGWCIVRFLCWCVIKHV
jgi:hypothetical protein